MNKSTAATLSLVMAVLMWPLGAYGFLALLMDFAPEPTPFQLWVYKGLGGGGPLTIAAGFFVAAAWLSGYSFHEAKRRAIASVAICSGFVAFIFWATIVGPYIAL